jgi:hypothetical protein
MEVYHVGKLPAAYGDRHAPMFTAMVLHVLDVSQGHYGKGF